VEVGRGGIRNTGKTTKGKTHSPDKGKNLPIVHSGGRDNRKEGHRGVLKKRGVSHRI